ncbi:hypothetical protein SD70_16640 [Gordoniibacillus kamchatkensis]|uniref:DUF1453 domain-containing protein n=1 Tax=Gordoniibacillus kamchatkensis TaxID=1590651 RepID=A0ABR5AG26_9BACL|nr:hypothetical protein [Paenibacillus sp. VKM B-2647]KIL40001.1 hypothetical protein SD70_16640 [Paenibacillus sp. VKM B-2647]
MNHAVSLLFVVLAVGFGIYRRIRRTVGFQKLEPRRFIFRCVLFAAVGLLVLAMAVARPVLLAGDAVGIICGLTLAYYGIRHLKFEKREQGWYYRTHGIVEAIVLVLFIGRIAYRLIEMALLNPGVPNSAAAGGAGANPYGDLSRDPITSAVLFVIVSYYLTFFTYLLAKGKTLEAAGS